MPPTSRRSRRTKQTDKTSSSLGATAGPTADDSCTSCEIHLPDNSKCMQCERCIKWFCLKCARLPDEAYAFMVSNASVHWFCPGCEESALKAAQTDKLIEERCQEFLGKFESRLKDVEESLETKVSKPDFDSLKSEMKIKDDRINCLMLDIQTLNKRIDLVRFEPIEKSKRVNNIVIRGLPETGNPDQDKAAVSIALAEIECADVIPSNISRLGQLKTKVSEINNSNSDDDQDDETTPTEVDCDLNAAP